MFIIKYLKSLLYIFISILIFTLLISSLSYFNLLGSALKYFKLIAIIVSMLIGGIFLGKQSSNKGYLEGIKIGVIVIFILFLLSYLGFDKNINLERIIYYLIILISSIFGSIIGINKKSKSEN